MILYDATVPLSKKIPVFPGDPEFRRERLCSIQQGDPFNLTYLRLSTHMGTHMDSPAHFWDGAPTVDEIPLETLMGPGVVLDMRGIPLIDQPALERARIFGTERILFKTDNDCLMLTPSFASHFVHLTVDGSAYLVKCGVKLVGIDYLSVDAPDAFDAPVHRALLSHGVVIVEGLLLSHIPPGPCMVYCFPLSVKGGDGSPTRVIVAR